MLKGFFEKQFKIQERGSTIRTEILAGLTVFFAIVSAVMINPAIISQGDSQIFNGVLVASCVAAALGCFCMAFVANLPFAIAPAMGLNAFFAFTIMPSMVALAGRELSLIEQYQMALACVLISGVLSVFITAIKAREAIIKGIPKSVKLSMGAGIGMFLALLGLQYTGIVVPDPATTLAMVNLSAADPQVVLGVVLALVCLIAMAVLHHKNVRGGMLIAILLTTALCYITGYSKIPENFNPFNIAEPFKDWVSISLFKMNFQGLFGNGVNIFAALGTLIMIVMSYAVVDIFDTVGTFLGTAQAGGMVNEEGEMEDMGKGLLADALAATTAGPMGTSTVTTYVESSLGFAEGAKTGMTPFVIGILFLISVIFTPVVTLIPSVAIGPALIFVGALMIGSLKLIDFDDITEALPAFLTVAMMPLTYSIANGVAFGLISHVVIKFFTGQRKDIKLPAVIVAILFILSYIVKI